ncbi:type II secretion system F family protein [Halorhodospira neutriphila]|uniref:Type II secretion system protein GspF domain-containing protein n=1 Tax=Halorhodospira neutriphila TaxID=168379 RepID=A0ABS1E4T0_9GAMM|nr:type II secretion system F family protein [Halorhodospira neutriphila]MBK1725819.1 hypothetical protein [Halorhodospira neutriphila]
MPFYLYTAIDRAGAPVRGRARHASLDELARELGLRGETLYRFTALPDGFARLGEALRRKPRTADVAEFCNNLAIYIGGGVDFQSALNDMADATRSGPMRRQLREVKRLLYAGYPFSEALRQTGAFPEIVVNMAAIGEESGTIDRTLADAGAHLDRMLAIRNAVFRALLYPMFALFVFFAALLFWLAFVIPQLEQVFRQMNVALPPITRNVLAISGWFQEHWLGVLVGVLLIPVALKGLRWLKGPGRLIDAGLWRMPIVGRLVRGSQWAFYFQYLGVMYASGVVITRALEAVRESTTNKDFRRRLAPIEEQLRTGEPLETAFARTRAFEPLGVRMIGLGEQTGSLDGQLRKLAEIYYRRVQNLVEVVSKLFEPIIVLVVGLFFVIFVVAVVGPIYQMVRDVGAGL